MINDSAGIEVPLIDKSERTSTAMGFRSAAVVEAVRGLCETPVLITSEADYVKVFGAPSVDKTGMASIEAYSLSQRQVPQVVVRAKNPALESGAKLFAAALFQIDDKSLVADTRQGADVIGTPADANNAAIFFKGEGDYACGEASEAGIEEANKSNIVLRFSKPSEKSAYAEDRRVVRLQVFDFAGDSHIDNDQVGQLIFNPTLSDVIDVDGKFTEDPSSDKPGPLERLLGARGTAQVVKYEVLAYVNGRPGKADSTGSSTNLWEAIAEAIAGAKKRGSDDPVLPGQGTDWKLVKDTTGEVTEEEEPTQYFETRLDEQGRSAINAFDLSISLAISATVSFTPADPTAKIDSAYLSVESGTLNVGSSEATGSSTIVATLSTSVILTKRENYMFVGDYNAYWAAYYNAYLKESWDLSFSYDDYDASYTSMQADAVLKASNYLVCKTNDVFGDYEIKWGKKAEDGTWIEAPDDLVGKLQYFTGRIDSNEIKAASKSYAYSQALSVLLGDNLTRWRCVCAPNLGDVMIKGDFVAAIEAAQESTLGLSNIGRAASVDVLNNLNGRHGNRFIADFSAYGYRSLNGRRTPFTMACLVAELLNRNFNNGNEARPPFGYTYGQVICNEISQTLTGPQRLMLARQYKVNPVNEDGGYYLWDERTSQEKETSLSDEHSILSFVWMKFQIYDTMKSFIAEYNDIETVNRGLSKLDSLCQNWITKKYVEEALADASKNVIGDETLRFTVRVRFKGVARYVVVEVVAYPQTQALAISLAMEEAA